MDMKLILVAMVLTSTFEKSSAEGGRFKRATRNSNNEAFDQEDVSEAMKSSPLWQLQRDLFVGYNPKVMPVKDPKDPVNVTVDYILFNLVSLDERDQTFATNSELVLVWNDYFLQWNPDDYGGVDQIWVDFNKIWQPDVILYNSASPDYNAGLVYTNAILKSDGTVRFLTNGAFISVCNTLNVDYFPFDEQTCYLKFSPWTMDITAVSFDTFKVRLAPIEDEGDLSVYTPIGEFKMISLVVEKHTEFDPCCPNTAFDDVTYYVKIHRRPMFFIINYIFPSVLINAIGTMVFYVPCDSGEKVTLGISAMLTMVVFLMTMTDALPPATATPLLSIYYCACVVLVTAEVLFSILVLNIFHRGQYGKRASDSTIAVAVFMAKVTFTDLKDPTGHFAERRAAMGDKWRRFWNKQEHDVHNPSTVRPMENKKDKLDEVLKSLSDEAAEDKFWRPMGSQGMPMSADAGWATRKEDEFATRFQLEGHMRGSSTAVEGQETPITLNGNLKLENAVTRLVKQADEALGIMAMTKENYAEDNYKESLKIEFMELARVYDRFFLIVSIVATAVTSTGILMSSPYSSAGPGK